jgi:AraC family transcriptional regulator of adaptative response/methylated-DNA-[protein]-cysteine methyltransferase
LSPNAAADKLRHPTSPETDMQTTDYARIERAIRFLETNVQRQPSLRDVAASVDLSEYHFQRMFARWAGISPKRFLQFQTAEHAKRLLADSRTVLDVAYETGLSGGGRLHDLFVSVEAMTPGQFKEEGAGVRIGYGVHETPFGQCFIAATERGICRMSFAPEIHHDDVLAELRLLWPRATIVADQAATAELASRIFPRDEGGRGGELRVVLRGTPFQIKVWEALLRIPEGAIASYDVIAEAIGRPGATRAVGTAVGRNPIAYLIPCHRVIRKTGAFGDYRWGSARKRAMLAWESPFTRSSSPDT